MRRRGRRSRAWSSSELWLPSRIEPNGCGLLVCADEGRFNRELVVFTVKADGIHVLLIAFGQKGRCEMKLFEVPMVVTSLVGLCFLAGPEVPAARADFTFGEPVHLDTVMPFLTIADSSVECFSSDGLEMFINSHAGGRFRATTTSGSASGPRQRTPGVLRRISGRRSTVHRWMPARPSRPTVWSSISLLQPARRFRQRRYLCDQTGDPKQPLGPGDQSGCPR